MYVCALLCLLIHTHTLGEEGRATGPGGTGSVPQSVTPSGSPPECHVGGTWDGTEEWEGGVGRRGGKEEWEGGVGRRGGKEGWEGGVGRRSGKEGWERGVGRRCREGHRRVEVEQGRSGRGGEGWI